MGRHISYYLTDSGYEIAIIYNSSSKKELERTAAVLQSKRVTFKFYKCDLSNIKALRTTVNKIGKDFRKIDLLVNNAGVIQKLEFENISQEDYDNVLNVNLRAALFVTQHCLPYLKKANNPSVINIASLGGLKNWVDYIPYCISKAGVIKLTYLLAKKLAPKVRVNAIAPGTIIIDGEESGNSRHVPTKSIPLKKYGKPEDITSAVRFLIECDYVTGQVITVDGGRTVL